MTQEEKDLLLKDLSARLLYEVKVTTTNPAVEFGVISGISTKNKVTVETKHADIVFDCTEVKPYLRPMSSMTEEETLYIEKYFTYTGYDDWDYVDWLNAHHFDYHGLIEKGLALEAPEGMYE